MPLAKRKLFFKITDRRTVQKNTKRTVQGRIIRGFEGARAPPSANKRTPWLPKVSPKMKGKLSESPFQNDIHDPRNRYRYVHRWLKFILHFYLGKTDNNFSFRFDLNGHEWKSTPRCFDKSPPMARSGGAVPPRTSAVRPPAGGYVSRCTRRGRTGELQSSCRTFWWSSCRHPTLLVAHSASVAQCLSTTRLWPRVSMMCSVRQNDVPVRQRRGEDIDGECLWCAACDRTTCLSDRGGVRTLTASVHDVQRATERRACPTETGWGHWPRVSMMCSVRQNDVPGGQRLGEYVHWPRVSIMCSVRQNDVPGGQRWGEDIDRACPWCAACDRTTCLSDRGGVRTLTARVHDVQRATERRACPTEVGWGAGDCWARPWCRIVVANLGYIGDPKG